MDVIFIKFVLMVIVSILVAFGIDNLKINLLWKIIVSFIIAIVLTTLIVL